MGKIFLMLFLNWVTLIEAQEINDKPKKYNLSICAIFKNEAKNLKEWIEYHRLVGVDHFYLYNIESSDEYKIILNKYVKEGVVTLINWRDNVNVDDESNLFMWALGTQIPAYENALNFISKKETKWLVFVDIEEFLISPEEDTITTVLERYDSYPGVILKCEYFDAAKINTFPKRELVIQALELANSPEINPQVQVEKMVFKPDLCHGFTWPPYKCIFKNLQIAAVVEKRELRINHYLNRKGNYFFARSKHKLNIDNRLLSQDQIDELLAANYEIEDHEKAIYKYVPELLKRLGHYSLYNW